MSQNNEYSKCKFNLEYYWMIYDFPLIIFKLSVGGNFILLKFLNYKFSIYRGNLWKENILSDNYIAPSISLNNQYH